MSEHLYKHQDWNHSNMIASTLRDKLNNSWQTRSVALLEYSKSWKPRKAERQLLISIRTKLHERRYPKDQKSITKKDYSYLITVLVCYCITQHGVTQSGLFFFTIHCFNVTAVLWPNTWMVCSLWRSNVMKHKTHNR